MTRIDIAPALDPEEWVLRKCGSLAVEQVDDEVQVVVRDPDGEVVSVSGPTELFALIALANDALPDRDPRKITLHAVFDVQVAAEIARLAGVGGVALRLVKLAGMLEAALRPRRIHEPELSQRG